MWTTIARVLLRNRTFFLVLVGFFTAFMAYHASDIRMGYGFARMMPDDDTVSIQNAEFEKTFGEGGNTVVIVQEDDAFFTPSHIAQWRAFEDSIRQVTGVANALSITSAYNISVNETDDQLNVHPLLSENPATQAAVDSFKTELMQLPFYKELLYTDGGKTKIMLIRISQEALYAKQIISTIEEIKGLNERFEARTGIELHTSGLPYIRMANTNKLKKEVYMLIFFTIVVTAILLFVFLRSIRATGISLLVVILGVVYTFGLLGLFQFELSILSSLIPPLVIVIGVPNCIYLINKYHQEFKLHNNKIKALQRVIIKIGTVTVLTNFTTALGFATFTITDSQALVEFGIVASTIILLVFMLSIILIPIIYSYLAPPKERHYKHFDLAWLQKLLQFLIKAVTEHRKAVYATTIIILACGAYGMYELRVTGNLTGDLGKDDPVYHDIKFIESKFHGVVPLELVIDTKRPKGVNKLRTLKKIDSFQKQIAELPQVSRSLSIVDFVKFMRQGILFGNPAMYDLPTRQEQQWMLKYLPKDQDNTNLMGSLVDSIGQKARVTMQMEDLGTTEMRNLQNQIRSIAHNVFDSQDYNIIITGSSVKFLRTTDYLIKNLIISMLLAIGLISVIMALLFGSGRMVFISIVPNLIPLLLTAALMGYLGVPLKPSTILIFSIAFGISIDDTIHFLARYRQELKSNGWHIANAVKTAILETGVSMFYTSVILFFGFSVFLMSSFGGTMAVGLLVAITLIFAMLTNLLILPSFLMSLDKLIRARDFSENIINLYKEENLPLEETENDLQVKNSKPNNHNKNPNT